MMSSIGRGQKQNSVAGPVPAPIGGINVVDSLAEMQANECVYAYDIIAQDYGMDVRPGYEEWANGWTSDARTIITFEGNDSADDKLWVATADGIFDTTTDGETAPTKVVTFSTTSGNAGFCSYFTWGQPSGDKFVCLCDGENGYYVYTQTTDTWAQITQGVGATQIDGTDPVDFVFCMAWKERIWFIHKETGNAWYLPVGYLYGTVTQYMFARQFKAGGYLAGLYNWTLDGGTGIDDYLVGISSGGDVVVYSGYDPAAVTTFSLVGTWSIGKLPAGYRNAIEYGGEVYLLSTNGLVGMTNLIKGLDPSAPQTYISRKISAYYRSRAKEVLSDDFWHMAVHSNESLLYINPPQPPGQTQIGFCMYFGNGAWSMVRNLPKNHTAEWNGDVYWISDDSLFKEGGSVDAVYLDTADGDPQAITWDLLTGFSSLGEPGRFKRCQYIRPNFLAESTPSYETFSRYDYDLAETDGTPVESVGDSGVFGTGTWGTALWAGGLGQVSSPQGATGIGRTVAVGLRGTSSSPTTLISFDVIADFGGIM